MKSSTEIIEQLNKEVWATIKPSEINGVGVFAIRDIPMGTVINNGEDISERLRVHEYVFDGIEKPIRDLILDRTIFYEWNNLLYFRHPNSITILQCLMNHSNNPNSDGIKTLKDIKCGEEITESYLGGPKLHKLTKEKLKIFIKYEL